MLKLLRNLLGFKDDSISGLGLEIRELIKGKEIDPQKLIELQTEINKMEAQHRTVFVAGWRPAPRGTRRSVAAQSTLSRRMLSRGIASPWQGLQNGSD